MVDKEEVWTFEEAYCPFPFAVRRPVVTYEAPGVPVRFFADQLPATGAVFSFTHNNLWFTNYRVAQRGPVTFRYALTGRAVHHAQPHPARRPQLLPDTRTDKLFAKTAIAIRWRAGGGAFSQGASRAVPTGCRPHAMRFVERIAQRRHWEPDHRQPCIRWTQTESWCPMISWLGDVAVGAVRELTGDVALAPQTPIAPEQPARQLRILRLSTRVPRA